MTAEQAEVVLAAEGVALSTGMGGARAFDRRMDRLYAAVIANRVATRFAHRPPVRPFPAFGRAGGPLRLAAASMAALHNKYRPCRYGRATQPAPTGDGHQGD
jgi:hypothetical protein